MLNPNPTLPTVTTASAARTPKSPEPAAFKSAPPPPPAMVPPPQALPRPGLVPDQPTLKLGLDVPLEFIMAVAQRGHASPLAPRTFTPEQLVAQVRKWVAGGLQVFCGQESCGFGFVLHHQLVAAGAPSFLITPIALNGQRKTDQLDARALGLRLARWVDGNRDELAPIRIPPATEQRRRATTRRRQFLARQVRALANRGHGQVAEYRHPKLPPRGWGARHWPKLAALDPWGRGLVEKLRELIRALEGQRTELETAVKARVKDQVRPKGLGELTLVTLDHEVCDRAAPVRNCSGWGASPPVGEMGRSPRSPQSDQTDPVGVELGLHCPDRSWWRAQKPRTPKRGDPGRPDARTELREELLRAGGERNCFEAERVKPSESEPDAAGPWFAPPLPRATPLRCRCAPREERLTANHPKKSFTTLLTTLIGAAAHG